MMDKRQISSEELAPHALDAFSDDQLSYIDEFTFFRRATGEDECWYAGELLAVWNGRSWNAELHQEE